MTPTTIFILYFWCH